MATYISDMHYKRPRDRDGRGSRETAGAETLWAIRPEVKAECREGPVGPAGATAACS